MGTLKNKKIKVVKFATNLKKFPSLDPLGYSPEQLYSPIYWYLRTHIAQCWRSDNQSTHMANKSWCLPYYWPAAAAETSPLWSEWFALHFLSDPSQPKSSNFESTSSHVNDWKLNKKRETKMSRMNWKFCCRKIAGENYQFQSPNRNDEKEREEEVKVNKICINFVDKNVMRGDKAV